MKICALASVLVLLVGTGTANAEPGDIVCCSTDSAGAEGDSYSLDASISSDGRYVAFESDASNLVPGDTNGERDVFRKDLQTGEIALCSTGSGGTQGNDWSYFASVSSDGRYVSFTSAATNLVPGDTGGHPDVFRKDLETGALVCCTVGLNGGLGDNVSGASSISSDGRYVAFSSAASNLVPGEDINWAHDIFRRDLETGAIVRCTTDPSGAPGNGGSGGPSISSDGRYVAFSSAASNLVPGDTNGEIDIFRKDLETGTLVRCSTDATGAQGNSFCDECSISADGRYVAFSSAASNLVPGDTNGEIDIFRKDLETGTLVRCSTGSAGGQAYNNDCTSPSISSDGRYVAFSSAASNLVPGDTNGYSDVFRKDLETGALVLCSADSNERQGYHVSGDPSISSDGRYVAFDSAVTDLVPGDTNGFTDIFRKEPAMPKASPFTVTSVAPVSASQFAFFLDVEITGTGFYQGIPVRMERGPSNIQYVINLTVTESRITGTLPLFGAEPGVYDVVVGTPGGWEARITGGFTVEPACGQGSGTALFMLGLTLGLLSLAGSSRTKKRCKA